MPLVIREKILTTLGSVAGFGIACLIEEIELQALGLLVLAVLGLYLIHTDRIFRH